MNGSGGVALVITDNLAAWRWLAASLAAAGFVATLCINAREALDTVLAGATFDLILAELLMPGIDAQELLRRLVRRRPRQAERLLFFHDTKHRMRGIHDPLDARVFDTRLRPRHLIAYMQLAASRPTFLDEAAEERA